jgi:protein SCO1/2
MEGRVSASPRGHWLAVGALALILAVTVAWWALALWPLPAGAPAWLQRTRAVCFGVAPGGLPDTYGWMTLVGEPAMMLGMLYVLWGDLVAAGLRALWRAAAGRVALGAAGVVLAGAVAAAGARVASAAAAGGGAPRRPVPAEWRRLDRPAPPLDLVDQHGRRLTLARFRGRPVVLAFAYAHCQTVCPLVVGEAVRARTLALGRAPVVVIVTVDPWRDTPSRLPAIAERWRLDGDAFVASGDTAVVAATLARWQVPTHRDLRTGEVAHATPVYLIAPDGRVAYAVRGGAGAASLAELVRRASR